MLKVFFSNIKNLFKIITVLIMKLMYSLLSDMIKKIIKDLTKKELKNLINSESNKEQPLILFFVFINK